MVMFGIKPAVPEQFTFGNVPFVLAFWEKDASLLNLHQYRCQMSFLLKQSVVGQ